MYTRSVLLTMLLSPWLQQSRTKPANRIFWNAIPPSQSSWSLPGRQTCFSLMTALSRTAMNMLDSSVISHLPSEWLRVSCLSSLSCPYRPFSFFSPSSHILISTCLWKFLSTACTAVPWHHHNFHDPLQANKIFLSRSMCSSRRQWTSWPILLSTVSTLHDI